MTHNNLETTLSQRGQRYGHFHDFAAISQGLKRAMRSAPQWDTLPDYMKESLEMDAHKTARILNGDPTYDDTWHDKAGYATLVELILQGRGI